MKILTLTEPMWGQKLLVFLNDYVNSHYILSHMIPVTADIFVFTYPLYIAGLYLYGIGKKTDFYKNAALYIFFSGVSSVMINLFIQMFVDKTRPEFILAAGKLLLKHIPDASFPSDHAAMSAAIATSVLIWGLKNRNNNFIYGGVIFAVFSLIMSFSRVAAGVHWPTDVLFGTVIGFLASCILISSPVYNIIDKYIFRNIVKLEKFLFRKVFQIEQN